MKKSEFSEYKLGRLAGLLYLILIPTSGAAYGVGQFLTSGDPITKIEAQLGLSKLAGILGAIGFIDYLLLALVLHKLLSPASRPAADAMLALVAVSVPVSLAAVARWTEALSLLQDRGDLDPDVVRSGVVLALRGYNSLISVSAIFWGLWLIPLGWLVIRSGIMPRAIGILLMLGSVFYVSSFVGPLLDPEYATTRVAQIIGFASGIPSILGGELAACLWLLASRRRTRSGLLETSVP